MTSSHETKKSKLLKNIIRLRDKMDHYRDLYYFNRDQYTQAVSKYNSFLKETISNKKES